MPGGSAAPPGDANEMRLRRLIMTSSKGLLDPPKVTLADALRVAKIFRMSDHHLARMTNLT
jgi:hypothetical protein